MVTFTFTATVSASDAQVPSTEKTLCTSCPYKFQPPLEKLNREATELHLFSEDYVTCKTFSHKSSEAFSFCLFLLISDHL